jgi:flagellar FliJ protein
MNRSKRLEPLVELAEKREEEAMRAMGLCQVKRDEVANRASTLSQYRNDYIARLTEAGEGGLSARVLMQYRSFLEVLNQTIAGQEMELRRVESDLAFRRQAWEKAHGYRLGLEKVRDASRASEARAHDQREQRESDDRAAQRLDGGWKGDAFAY